MFDITVFIAGIRQPLWPAIYHNLYTACQRYKWQLLISSPFNLPVELQGFNNVNLIQDRGNVTRANQKGLLNIDTELFFLTVDDGFFMEHSLDLAIDLWKEKCNEKDLVCMRYSEAGAHFPLDYWRMWHHPILRLPGIPEDQLFGHHPIMNTQNFYNLGGFDCQFEYLTYPLLDFNIRLVKNGGKIHLSPTECAICTHYPESTGDHGPVVRAQLDHDQPIFDNMYSQDVDRIRIDYDNWKNSSPIWERRFTKSIPKTYEELCHTEGYHL